MYQSSVGQERLTYLDEVKRIPLTPPNVESDTKIGIIHHSIPYSLFENIWKTNSNESKFEYQENT